jgi:DNA-binding transcriptional ArsR family regulator
MAKLLKQKNFSMNFEPSEMFKVLGVETRIKIIELLKSKGPIGAKNIAEQIGVTSAAVSQHLKILRQAGLVRSERKGYWIPYAINEEALENCRDVLNEVCTCGCRGTGGFRDKELDNANLESLKKYEKELENELRTVQKRIEEIGSQGR